MSDGDGPVALQLRGVAKRFQGQWALRGVDLDLRAGEVHALLGQNGSGKSTLIKILAGYHQPEPGATALRRGERFALGSAQEAQASGIRFIHQDLALVDDLDVCDNFALGERYQGRWWLSDRRERAAVRGAFEKYGIDIDVSRPVRALSPAQKALTAIVRALYHAEESTSVLVLDEPTATLPSTESEKLFELVRAVRDRGGAVLYVTHRLPEVFALADRVTVLRDGERVGQCEIADTDEAGLVEMIVGRPLETLYTTPPPPRDDVLLSLSGVSGTVVRDLSLDVHAGEIVGVTGLLGSGTDELVHLAFGANRRRAGTVTLAGADIGRTPYDAIAAGVAFAPADRKRLGGIAEWTLTENVTLPRIQSRGIVRWLSYPSERRNVAGWLRRFDVSPADPLRTFSSLSGGNQQKTVLARWLRCGARAFLLEEPTQGVDIGAKASIYAALAEVAKDGAALLVISSDVEELVSICDRVAVLRNGRIAAVLPRGVATVERLTAECVRVDPPLDPMEPIHA